jgi:hypothetical protein
MRLDKATRLVLINFMRGNKIDANKLAEILNEECRTIEIACKYCGEHSDDFVICEYCGSSHCRSCGQS